MQNKNFTFSRGKSLLLVAVKGPSRPQSLEEGKVGQGMRGRRSHQGRGLDSPWGKNTGMNKGEQRPEMKDVSDF